MATKPTCPQGPEGSENGCRGLLAGDCFEWYRGRIAAQLAKADPTISSLAITDNTYVYWYLKGSWAFWDLEALTGRDALLAALAATYRKHVGTVVDTPTFRDTLGSSLGFPLYDHFDHWFDGSGFAPRHRQ